MEGSVPVSGIKVNSNQEPGFRRSCELLIISNKTTQHVEQSFQVQRPRLFNSLQTYIRNKTKVISADLLDFDFDCQNIIMLGNISVLVTFQFS